MIILSFGCASTSYVVVYVARGERASWWVCRETRGSRPRRAKARASLQIEKRRSFVESFSVAASRPLSLSTRVSSRDAAQGFNYLLRAKPISKEAVSLPHRTPGARGTDAASSPRRAERARRRDRLSFRFVFFLFLHRQPLHHARERAFASRTPRHSRRAPARHRRSSRRERRRWPARMLRCIRRLYRVSLPSPSPSRTSSRRVLMDTDSEEWPALGHRAAGRGVHVRFDAPTPMDRDVAPPSRALPRARRAK